MFFPDSLKEAKALTANGTLPTNFTLPNNQQIQFTHCFKYLSSLITTKLNEDAKIKTHIKNPNPQWELSNTSSVTKMWKLE
jgi:hypothetical protein